MYYKIENADSEIFKKLYALRLKEHEINKENRELIIKEYGSDFSSYLYNGEQKWNRCKTYKGFEFHHKIDINGWKSCEDAPEIYIPNKRTKNGKKIIEFLNSLKSTSMIDLLDILDLDLISDFPFSFPFLEIIDDILILSLDNNYNPTDVDLIEITKKEFNQLYDSYLKTRLEKAI